MNSAQKVDAQDEARTLTLLLSTALTCEELVVSEKECVSSLTTSSTTTLWEHQSRGPKKGRIIRTSASERPNDLSWDCQPLAMNLLSCDVVVRTKEYHENWVTPMRRDSGPPGP